MKLIFKIARTELRNLFYSPIAWFLTIAFFVQCAIVYTNMLNASATTQEMGGIGLLYMDHLTDNIFVSPIGLFSNVMQNLYLYIPLLTMGLISREINGGMISLLYSSPVKIREIVFGKYLAMMIYSLVLVAVVGVFMIAGVINIRSADFGILLSAALGFYLLLCAYSAIGLFMSSLTSYQVVAAVSTFVMIGALSYIGNLWQGVDFVRDLTYFLSLNGRTQHMLRGLITTKDVLYFIIIVYIFLGLSIYKLQGARESKAGWIKAGRYAAIVVSALLIGYISSRPGLIGYWDTTANKDNTLTPNAQAIIKKMGDAPLEITSYSNLLDNYYYLGLPTQRSSYLSRWEPYQRFKPAIDFHYVNYYDTAYGNGYDMFRFYKGKNLQEIAEQKIKGAGLDMDLFKKPAEIRKMIDLKPELNRYVMRLEYKGRSTFLRIFNDQMLWPSETEVSAAFKRLLQAKMPKIVFVTGNGERDIHKKGDREYKTITNEKTFRYALINQGFDVDTLSLETGDIPDSIAALVLADPQTALSPVAMQKIQQYIARGGDLLIAGEPGRQDILNPLLKPLGVQIMNGMLEQKSDDYSPAMVLPHLTKAGIGLSKSLDRESIDTLPVTMDGVAGLLYKDTGNFHAEPLLTTEAGPVHNTLARNPDFDMVAVDDAHTGVDDMQVGVAIAVSNGYATPVKKKTKMSLSPATFTGNGKETYTTALALTRSVNGKQQRIIVTGDADFMSNKELMRGNLQTANFYLNTALFSWMDYNQFPVDTSRPDAKDNRVNVSTDGVGMLKILFIWVIPTLLLLFGSILLIRRKRK